MISDFLIFGGIWFWIFIGSLLVFIIGSLESPAYRSEDNGGGALATFLILGGFAVYYLFGSSQHITDLLAYAKQKPTQVIGFVIGYYVIGVIWALTKWYFFLVFLKEEKYYPIKKAPRASEYKNKITSWLSYWPFSMIWTFTAKFFHRSFEYVQLKTAGLFDSISDNVFKDVPKK